MYDMTLQAQYSPHWAVICNESLGTNSTGGRDFWITLRGRNDRLSNKFVAMGMVDREGKLTVCEFMCPFLVDYMEAIIAAAMNRWSVDQGYLQELEQEDMEGPLAVLQRVDRGFLGYMPEEHPRMFVEYEVSVTRRRAVDRFFFAQTRKTLAKLRSEKGESTVSDGHEYFDPLGQLQEA